MAHAVGPCKGMQSEVNCKGNVILLKASLPVLIQIFLPREQLPKRGEGGIKYFKHYMLAYLFIYLFIVTTGYFRVPFCFETFKTSGVLSFFCTHAHTRTHNTVLRHEISTEKPRFPLI